ncbi:MAG: divergent polysaccharide deacetylase family protein [Candidatus Omnitrophota bacterium]
MKQQVKPYKITIAVLIFIIIVQWLMLAGKKPAGPKELPLKIKGKIAIVIDDWGYNLNNLNLAEEMRFPFTASVLPNLSYSSEAAWELERRGIEVILHLPMEPSEKYRLEINTILVSMGEADIRGIIRHGLDSLKGVKGVSNHMGSLATADARTMKIVLRELKLRKLYFLDSYVTAKSVAGVLAQQINLGFARRDIFLDNKLDPEYIRRQMEKLKIKARKQGYAVGIGHDHRLTLLVLKDLIPQIEKEGYKFVFVSELIGKDR